MINYLKESKYGDLNKKTQKSRLSKDLPYLSKIIFDDLIKNTDIKNLKKLLKMA